MTPFRRQVLFLTLFSCLVVTPGLLKSGMNIVTDTYERAADFAWEQGTPYANPNGKGDLYKYSPLFALLYGAFAWLPNRAQALAWAYLGIFVFWCGISRWFLFTRGSPWPLWVALVVCSMEMDGSIRYQQINALMTGLLLWGLAEARDGQSSRAGFWLAVNTNFKVLPVLFLGLLAFPYRRAYWTAAFATSLTLLLLPALIWGPGADVDAHLAWVRTLTADMGSRGLLDVGTVFEPLLGSPVSQALRGGIVLVSLALLGWMRFARPRELGGLFYPVATGCLLLFSPRSESPTFVLFAPAYLFLVVEALKQKKAERAWLLGVVAVGAFLTTFSFNDLWPKAVWDPRALAFAPKTWGTLWLWSWSCVWLVRRSSRA